MIMKELLYKDFVKYKNKYLNGEKICVWDVEGVLLDQIVQYENNKIRKKDTYRLNKKAYDALFYANVDFDKVLLWTYNIDSLSELKKKASFRKYLDEFVEIAIYGIKYKAFAPIKPLNKLTNNLSNIVLIENDRLGRPLNRTVQVNGNNNILGYYEIARKLVFSSSH